MIRQWEVQRDKRRECVIIPQGTSNGTGLLAKLRIEETGEVIGLWETVRG